jgi:hypothetical protein
VDRVGREQDVKADEMRPRNEIKWIAITHPHKHVSAAIAAPEPSTGTHHRTMTFATSLPS